MMQTGYSARLRRATWLAFGVAPLVGIGGALLLRRVGPGEYFWLVFPILLTGCGLALLACVPWWKRLDDMQKQGHLVSWYWGGLAGGIASLMALVASRGVRSDLANGGMIVLLSEAVGFVLFWAVWAYARRGPKT
jgi:hypothetical protein